MCRDEEEETEPETSTEMSAAAAPATTKGNPAYNTPYSAIEALHSFQNSGAWERFVTHYRPLVAEIARRKGINDPDDRDQILTDVCVKLQEQFRQRRAEEVEADGELDHSQKRGYWVREKGKFRNWIWGLAEFKALEFNRTRRRDHERRQREVGLHGEGGRDSEDDVVHQLADPVDALEQKLTRGFLEELVRQLFEDGKVRPRDARIFVERVIHETPAEKVAKAHKTTANNVYQIVHSVRAHLRPMLDAYLESGTAPGE